MANEEGQPEENEEQALARVQARSLAALRQLCLQVDVRLGSAEITIGELLELQPGDALALERRLDEPVELIVGEQVIAQGELVAVEEQLGVRITKIVAQPEANL